MTKEAHALRVFVADVDGRSCPPWRFWVNESKSDVYFAHRELAGEMKGSLHASGSWQYGVTEQRALGKKISGWSAASRHLKVWKRPSELFPGVTRAVSIGIPSSELQKLPASGKKSKSIISIAAPTAGRGVEISIFFVSRDADLGGAFPGEKEMATSLLAAWPLPSGETVFIVHREFDVPETTLQDIRKFRRLFAHLKDTTTARARFGIFGINDVDGSAFIVEGAVHPDLAAERSLV